MPKFSVVSAVEFRNATHCGARVARVAAYKALDIPFTHVVTCEASDGSWCEFDAEDFEHAKGLAVNAVDHLSCRGSSVWSFNQETGKMARNSVFHYYADCQ